MSSKPLSVSLKKNVLSPFAASASIISPLEYGHLISIQPIGTPFSKTIPSGPQPRNGHLGLTTNPMFLIYTFSFFPKHPKYFSWALFSLSSSHFNDAGILDVLGIVFSVIDLTSDVGCTDFLLLITLPKTQEVILLDRSTYQ